MLMFFALSFPAQTKTPSKDEKPSLPNLTLNKIDGTKWNLHDERGNLVLLNFWATWCAPCREEIPVLVELSTKYKSKGLKVVGVSVDSENLEQINEFIKDFNMNYPVVLTVPGSLLSQQESVPMTLLIDENSRLVKKYVGAAEGSLFEKDIKDLLSKRKVQKKK
jgi:thiol-disulfide isomerase/thioredoxin